MAELLSPQAQAVLLLTARFSNGSSAVVRPLTIAEWGRFARWLHESGRSPADLLVGDPSTWLGAWRDPKVGTDRIGALLARSAALAIAIEKWQRSGLWIVTRGDADYPLKLKSRLGLNAPPVLFGCGHPSLLSQRAVAIVGSRDAGEMDCAWTREIAAALAREGRSIISGGARGVDDAAIEGALAAGGTGVAILSDSLLRQSSSSRFREALTRGDLALLSPFNPEAGFDVGNAMARNKYVYCLSESAVVTAVSEGKGGTWAGARECLQHGWVPVWVRAAGADAGGASALIGFGAKVLPTEPEPAVVAILAAGGDVGSQAGADASGRVAEGPVSELQRGFDSESDSWLPAAPRGGGPATDDSLLAWFKEQFAGRSMTLKEIKTAAGGRARDVSKWIKRALKRGELEKSARPVRYRVPGSADPQESLGL